MLYDSRLLFPEIKIFYKSGCSYNKTKPVLPCRWGSKAERDNWTKVVY